MKKIAQNKIFKIVLTVFIINLLIAPVVLAEANQPAEQNYLGDDIQKQSTAFLGEAGLAKNSPTYIVAQIIQAFLGFLGVIFIVLVIYAGFLWMTSAGNDEKIGKAKKIMIAAIIGLAIILSAYIITVFVTDKLIAASIQKGKLFF